MTLMYLTACDSDGRDYTILLDVARIAAIAPYAESSPGTSWLISNHSHRPRNREYLRVVMGPEREYVVLASEWPRLKQMLTRLNGGGFNRLGNDTDELEQPRYLPSAPRPRREEGVESYPQEILCGAATETVATETVHGATEVRVRRCAEASPAGYAVSASEGAPACSPSR